MNDIRVGHTTKGELFVVSVEDWDWVSKTKWHTDTNGYIARTGWPSRKKEYLHRLVNQTPKGMYTDHINGFRHDCTRRNLRTCTNAQNAMNQKLNCKSTSGAKGVSWFKADQVWTAHIKLNRKKVHLGRFVTKEQAIEAYNAAAKQHFGSFAKLNPTP